MKRRIYLMAALVVGIGLASCSVDTSGLEDVAEDLEDQMEAADSVDGDVDSLEDEEVPAEITSGILYQCPIDCENGPAYPDPGPCKKCGEEMIEI